MLSHYLLNDPRIPIKKITPNLPTLDTPMIFKKKKIVKFKVRKLYGDNSPFDFICIHFPLSDKNKAKYGKVKIDKEINFVLILCIFSIAASAYNKMKTSLFLMFTILVFANANQPEEEQHKGKRML